LNAKKKLFHYIPDRKEETDIYGKQAGAQKFPLLSSEDDKYVSESTPSVIPRT
jgi:hypothetical protein